MNIHSMEYNPIIDVNNIVLRVRYHQLKLKNLIECLNIIKVETNFVNLNKCYSKLVFKERTDKNSRFHIVWFYEKEAILNLNIYVNSNHITTNWEKLC